MKPRVVLLFVAASLATGCLWVLEKAAPDAEGFARDPDRAARGRYLVEHVATCFSCHPAGDVATGSAHFGRDSGYPADVWAPNLSPDTETGLGNWTDGLVARAIREGVDNDHEALVPVMPYLDYREMSDADVKAVVTYLRSRPPVRLAVPPRQVDLVYGLLLNLVPKPVGGKVAAPDPRDTVVYGKYVATLASCGSCHSPKGPDGRKPELAFTSPDITQDPDRGVGKWSDQQLGDAITKGIRPDGTAIDSRMPWQGYAGMAETDLAALIAYLRTIPPAGNKPVP